MKCYYLDIETDSHKTPDGDIDFAKSPIIAITYQQIAPETGVAKSDKTTLKSWEATEEDILKKFITIFNPFDKSQRWDFIPIGFNLTFDFVSLLYRWKSIGIPVSTVSIFRHPHLDIQPIVTMFNHGIFKGASLENFAGKKGSGADIKALYDNQDYPAIESYIEDETACFLKLYQFIAKQLPILWQQSHFLEFSNKE